MCGVGAVCVICCFILVGFFGQVFSLRAVKLQKSL